MTVDWGSAALGFFVGLIIASIAWVALGTRRRPSRQVLGVAPVFGTAVPMAAAQMPMSAPVPDPRLEQMEAELNALRRRVAQVDLLQNEVATLRVALARGTGADPFERIRGIGAKFAQKLHDAGFLTFEQLSRASEEELRAIIQPEEWQRIDFGAWKQEAQEWANGMRQMAGRR